MSPDFDCWREETDPDAAGRGLLDLKTRYAARLAGYIRAVTRDSIEADDLIADVWAEAWCALRSSEQCADLGDWLITLARRSCAIWMRPRRREIHLDLASHVASPDRHDLDAAIEEESRREAVAGWVRELPRRQMLAVWLRSYLGLSFADIANAMDCSLSTAKTHFSRGVRALRGHPSAGERRRESEL